MATPLDPRPWQAVLACAHRGDGGALLRWSSARAAALQAARVEPRDGEPYGRRVLSADAHGEVMLASWHAGAACAPHDHGRARGMVVVLEGRFTETVHAASPRGLRTTGSRAVSESDVLRVAEGVVHEMRAEERALTLHVYVPGVHAMRVYDRQARATLRVADGCGAWVPSDPSLVRRRWAWDAEQEPALPARRT